MIEHKTERVDPRLSDDVIETYENFGWTLCSSDEIYNESTEIVGVDINTYGDGLVGGFMKGFTGHDGTINVRQRKNVTNYVVLKFERDTETPCYGQLSNLEKEYYTYAQLAVKPEKPTKRTVASVVAWAIIIISFIKLCFEPDNSPELWELIVSAAVFLFTVPLVAVSWVRYKKKKADYEHYVYNSVESYNQAKLLSADIGLYK